MTGKCCKCLDCGTSITKTQLSIQCGLCSQWVHASCVGASKEYADEIKGNEFLAFVCSSCKKNPRSDEERSLREEISQLNNKIDAFINSVDDGRKAIKQSLADGIAEIKQEMSMSIQSMKTDIVNCTNIVRQVESSAAAKISLLEAENNVLHKKLNRGDVVIGGLPSGIKSITDVIIQLGSFYKVTVNLQDINHAYFISNKKAVLVKFNNVFLRDEIMHQYFKTIKTRPLKVADIIVDPGILREDIEKRVFLNDHYSPAAGRLNSICRKLLKDKAIKKFKLINAARPKAKLTFPDNREVEYGALDCAALLKEVAATTVPAL